jgi:hypothetical protein
MAFDERTKYSDYKEETWFIDSKSNRQQTDEGIIYVALALAFSAVTGFIGGMIYIVQKSRAPHGRSNTVVPELSSNHAAASAAAADSLPDRLCACGSGLVLFLVGCPLLVAGSAISDYWDNCLHDDGPGQLYRCKHDGGGEIAMLVVGTLCVLAAALLWFAALDMTTPRPSTDDRNRPHPASIPIVTHTASNTDEGPPGHPASLW